MQVMQNTHRYETASTLTVPTYAAAKVRIRDHSPYINCGDRQILILLTIFVEAC